MPDRTNAIYLRFDDAFLPFARACLNSIRHNYPEHPSILADYAGEDARMISLLESMKAERLPPEAPPEFVRYLSRKRAPQGVADRFKLWRNRFDRFDTILHLDADTLVLKPLDDLLTQSDPYFVSNHENTPGVRIFHSDHEHCGTLRDRLAEDDLTFPGRPDDMANAGMFVLPRAFRNPQTLAVLANLARRYGEYFAYADQSLLSLWLQTLAIRPSLNYADNYQTPFFTESDATIPLEDVRILHFSSQRKPGTRSFMEWTRVGAVRDDIIAMFEYYRDVDI